MSTEKKKENKIQEDLKKTLEKLGRAYIGQIAKKSGHSEYIVSKNLKVMEAKGIVSAEKQTPYTYYSLSAKSD